MLELTGDRAVVTGGASGIGAAVTVALQAEGVRVASLDLDPGGPADHRVVCDVTDEASVAAAVDEAVGLLGGLDYAFVNAGVAGMGSIGAMPAAEWDRVVDVNLRGVFLTVQRVARHLEASGTGGAIVITSSSAGQTVDLGMVHYSVSKIGVRHLAAIAARELGPHGIRVNVVAPGLTETPMTAATAELPGYHDLLRRVTPLGRIGAPDDIAEAVLALFALRWVTGQTLAVDGGMSLVPGTDIPGITIEMLDTWTTGG